MKTKSISPVDAIKEFTERILKKYDGLIKAVWVYGSFAKKTAKRTSDIDMMVLLDDTNKDIPIGFLYKIQDEVEGIVEKIKKDYGVHIHVQQPKRLSDWWDLLRSGEPWVFTSMKKAIPIYDPSGYVEPISKLLNLGRMSGTYEKAEALIQRGPSTLKEVKRRLLEDITSELLSAMVESAQATLMFYGIAPPSPQTIDKALEKNFVRKNLLEPGFVEMIRDFYNITEKIDHNEITKMSAKEIGKWIKRAKIFVLRMNNLFSELEKRKKREIIEESHKEAFEACKKALKKLGVKPDEKNIIKFIEKNLIKPGLVSKDYLDILKKIVKMKEALNKGKLEEIPEKYIYSSRMYAKNLKLILEGVYATKKTKKDSRRNSK